MKKILVIAVVLFTSMVAFAEDYNQNDLSVGVEVGTNVLNRDKFNSNVVFDVYGNYHHLDMLIGASFTKRGCNNDRYCYQNKLKDSEIHLGVGYAHKFKTTRLSAGAMVGVFITDKGNYSCGANVHENNNPYCEYRKEDRSTVPEFGVYIRCTQQIVKHVGISVSCQYMYHDDSTCTWQKDKLYIMGGINITI